jgi:alkylation response protein AidB-like acyl-CoA dehydrogenase
MHFGFTQQEETFRKEVSAFFKKEATPELLAETVECGGGIGPVFGRKFMQKMGTKGWLCPTWPKEYGGLGSSQTILFIIRDEMAYWQMPSLLVAPTIVGPCVLRVGNDDIKKEFLPRIARGEIEFALGYTEPQAGSDLASLEMRVEDGGDHFLLNGQKMFSTLANHAQYHWLAARTDTSVPKHKGISLMIVDLKSPGITIRSLVTIAGWKTNEVFYDNVKVPKSNLIGQLNRGFYYMLAALDFERMLPNGMIRRLFDELLSYCMETKQDGKTLSKDPIIRQKLAEMAIELEAADMLYYQLAYMLDNKVTPSYQSSMQKLFSSELVYRLGDIASEIIGPRGQLQHGSKYTPISGDSELFYREGILGTIVGGTSEIQRNIIALRGLGLPLF